MVLLFSFLGATELIFTYCLDMSSSAVYVSRILLSNVCSC